jgi:hypothetical protein
MNISQILSSLRAERDRINKALAALEGLDGGSTTAGRTNAPSTVKKNFRKKKGGLTAAGRKRLSDNMKKRWAERKKKSAKAA